MKKVRNAFGVLALAVGVAFAQAQNPADPAASTPSKTKHKTQHQLELDLEQLNDKYDRLEKEMAEMKAEAGKREAELAAATKLAQQAVQAQAEAGRAAETEKQREASTSDFVTQQGVAVDALKGAVADLKANSASIVETIQTDQKRAETPSVIPFMGVGLKPGGFLAAETVDRQRGIGGDINTQFSGIPFSGATTGRLSEFNASGRQSRASLLAEGKLSSSTVRGYYEGDFLSAGTTSNDNQSNSYTFRQRQMWAQAELASGWTFTGGQMWSLATEYKSGLTNLQEHIPLTIDAQYNVGFTWERQYGFRVVKKIGNRFWAGMSAEEAQTLNIGGHNLPDLVYQQAGNSGGLYNSTTNYSFNFAPDLIAKVVYEPKFGHFEVFSIGRFFRARDFPNEPLILPTVSSTSSTLSPTSPSTVGAFTTKTAGGGVGANARISLGNKLDIGLHGLAGDGLGRYSSATLPDLTAHQDGTLELLVSGSALGSLEWHATKRLDVYGYFGGEFVKRAWYPTSYVAAASTSPYDPPAGQPIVGGYGAPTNFEWGCSIEVQASSGLPATPGFANGCVADNRNIQEATGGYWLRFYKGPKGMLQQGLQYSYVVRHTWQGVGLAADQLTGTPAITGSPKANDNMIFTSFRYYLPQ